MRGIILLSALNLICIISSNLNVWLKGIGSLCVLIYAIFTWRKTSSIATVQFYYEQQKLFIQCDEGISRELAYVHWRQFPFLIELSCTYADQRHSYFWWPLLMKDSETRELYLLIKAQAKIVPNNLSRMTINPVL
jgi:hypothetical protein